MNLKTQIDSLKSEIESVSKKEECVCGKTLFFYDDEYIYIKCRKCSTTKKFKR